jgi:acetyl esterase/lipase
VTALPRRLGPLVAALGLLSAAISLGQSIPAARAQSGGVRIAQDVEYSAPDGEPLLLDAFVPEGTGPFPALIAIHGGGWALRDKTDWDNSCRELAMAGFACFTIDYRLAPAHPYPAAVDDARAAVQWVRDHAAEYSVDPSRLGAIGGSAGAHLAAMVGYMGKGSTDTGSRVRVVILWSAATDLTTLVATSKTGELTGGNVADFLGCDLADCEKRQRQASPVTYVDPTDPSTLIANSTDELMPLSQAKELAGVLKDAGVPYELHVVDGKNHGNRLKNQLPRDGVESVWDLSIDFARTWIETSRFGTPSPSASPVPTGSFDAAPESTKGDGTLFMIVAAVGVAVVLGMVGVPLIRRRRLR